MNKFIEIINSPVVLDVQTGLTQAKNTIMDTAKFMVNNIAIPIICTILAGVLIFSIVSAVKLHKDGQDYSKKITAIVVIVLVIAVVATAPTWVWTMVGV